MSKSNTVTASVPLTWVEDDAVETLSERLGIPRAGVLRLGLLALVKEHIPTEAPKILRSRIQRGAMIFFVAVIPFAPFTARRPSRNGMMARTAAHPARRQEVCS